jgi:hypothetical protein
MKLIRHIKNIPLLIGYTIFITLSLSAYLFIAFLYFPFYLIKSKFKNKHK